MLSLMASQITEGKSQGKDPDATPTLIHDMLVRLFFRSHFLLCRGAKHGKKEKGQTSTSRIRVEVESAKKTKKKLRKVKTLRNSSSKPRTWEAATNTEQQKCTTKSQSLKEDHELVLVGAGVRLWS